MKLYKYAARDLKLSDSRTQFMGSYQKINTEEEYLKKTKIHSKWEIQSGHGFGFVFYK